MRHSVLLSPAQQYRISIHAPLTGCDFIIADDKTSKRYFNPRTPYGMRLPVFSVAFVVPTISIHAPLTGCDLILKKILIQHHYFNPRTPYGMRPLLQSHSPSFAKFQSTHPLRDATLDGFLSASSYALFQSTHPLRDATAKKAKSLLEFHSF